MRHRSRHVFAFALAVALAATPAALAAKKEKTVDRIWVHPRVDSFNVGRISMLPVTSFDNDFAAEKQVEGSLAQQLAITGYRWVSAPTTREMLRGLGGDSLVKVYKTQILNSERVDSLATPDLCARLRCDALLTVRVDHWEKREMEWNQAGKPSTSVKMHAALIDSSGTLLWSASGSHTAEGPHHDPSAGKIGVSGSGLDLKPVTGQGGAPEFAEVVATIGKRWAATFPKSAAAAAKP